MCSMITNFSSISLLDRPSDVTSKVRQVTNNNPASKVVRFLRYQSGLDSGGSPVRFILKATLSWSWTSVFSSYGGLL